MSTAQQEKATTPRSMLRDRLGLWITLAVIVLIGVPPIITGNAATRESMFTILMMIALASSLNLLLGYTGYISFGHIVFFGLGGYVGLYFITVHGWHLVFAGLAGGAAAALLAYLLGKSILRLRGAYFALATIGVNEAMRAFVNNYEPFGKGVGLQMPFSEFSRYGGPANALWVVYWAILILTLGTVVLSHFVKRSKFGLGLMAIREDEDAAEVMGVKAPSAKTWSYVLSAVIPGIIGVLFFFKNTKIEPSTAFHLTRSIEMLVMVMLGGLGTVLGPVLGAGVYQYMRKTLLTNSLFKNIQLAVAGLLLLVVVQFIPRGAIGWLQSRSKRLREVLE